MTGSFSLEAAEGPEGPWSVVRIKREHYKHLHHLRNQWGQIPLEPDLLGSCQLPWSNQWSPRAVEPNVKGSSRRYHILAPQGYLNLYTDPNTRASPPPALPERRQRLLSRCTVEEGLELGPKALCLLAQPMSNLSLTGATGPTSCC